MKILTGRLRGRSIQFRPNPHLRPTSDRARKAVFDMLQGQIEGKYVLDLFSGTGAMGFEALSQGAARVVFVEIDKAQSKKIEDDLRRLGLEGEGRVIAYDALTAIRQLSKKDGRFDLIFLDPPYEKDLAQAALQALAGSALLSEGALAVLECRGKEEAVEHIGDLRAVKVRDHGDTRIVLYQKEKR